MIVATLAMLAMVFSGYEPMPKQQCVISELDGGPLPKAPYFEAISSDGPTDAWAVGYYYTNGLPGVYALADHWNGKTWTVLYPPSDPEFGASLFGVAARTPSDVWAVGATGQGQALFEHWNGTSWTASGATISYPGSTDPISGVASFGADRAFAVGEIVTKVGDRRPLVERWNGTSWSPLVVPGPASGLYDAIGGTSARDVWAVGATYQNSTVYPLALHYDGAAWKSMTLPIPPNDTQAVFNSVVAISMQDVWATGGQVKVGDPYGEAKTLTEHWNGTSWSVVPSPNVASTQFSQNLTGVSARAPDDIWAVGGDRGSVAMHSDGKTWTLVNAANKLPPSSGLRGVATVGPGMFAAGFNANKPLGPKPGILAMGRCSGA